MTDENKNEQYEIDEDIINLESPSKQNKFNSKRKRKELINSDSENEQNENINDNNNIRETDKEEVKKNENNEETNNRKAKYENNNKFKTMERNDIISPPKDNLVLQEKLKKIFMNRDKLKYQYIKQDIPDNLKYNSDDSDSSEFSQLRKSKNKKNMKIIEEKGKNELNNKFENENEKNIQNANNNNANDNINVNININNNNDLKKEEEQNIQTKEKEIKNEIKIENEKEKEKENESNINEEKKEEKVKYFNKNQKNEDKDKKKFNTYNINLNNNKYLKEDNQEKEKEKEKDNEQKKENLDDSKNKYIRGYFKYNETSQNDKDDNNDKNKKEITKKNILLKVLEKRNKKDINAKNNDNTKTNDKKEEVDNSKNIRNNVDSQEKKQKLLKLLIEKKNNTIDKDNQNEIGNGNGNENIKKEEEKKENGEEDEDKDKTLEMKYDEENEDRRRRLMNQIKSDSNNSTLIKTHGRFDKKEKEKDYQQENKEQEEKENIDDREDSDKDKDNDKGTYIPNNHKNKLTINLRPKEKSSKRESASNIKPKDFYNEDDEDKQKNSQKDLLSIIGKLKEKKSAESKIQNSPKSPYMELNHDHDETNKDEITESETEKFEKNMKKEKKIEEKKFEGKKETQYAEKENINNNIYKGRRVSAKNIRSNNLNSEEMKRRKKLEEDLRAEIMKKDSVNDIKDDDTSTINNTTKSNIQVSQYENEEKSNEKQFTYQGIPTRNTSNVGTRYKNEDENAFPTEIVVNDVPSSNLDRSFDAVNTYMKRRVKGKNSMSIYKPKKANNMRNRSQEKVSSEMLENSPSSLIPNQNMVYSHSKHILNSPCYIRNKNTFNSKNCLTKNNHSFCEFPSEANTNLTKGNNNINMEIDLGGGLNSSFDAYNAMQYNNKTSKNTSNFNGNIDTFYGTGSKKFSGYSKKTNIPVRNMNYNKNTNVNTFYKNENVNKSYGYLNTGFNNNIFDDNNNLNPSIGNKNINYFYGMNQPQFVTYNNNSHNQIINQNYYNNNPLKTYANQLSPSITHDAFENNFIQNTPVLKRNVSTKNNNINYIYNNNNTFVSNTNYNNNFTYNNNNNNIFNNNYTNNTAILNHNEKNTSINIEDLLILEEKFIQIIMSLNKSGSMHNECFEFWNYYYNCSLYGCLEKLFKPQDILNVKIAMNYILMSVMICYDYSFEIEILKGEHSLIEDIIKFNHKNLIIIYEHILSKVSAESKSNIWVFKLQDLINNYNKLNVDKEYVTNKKREISPIDKIVYNMTIIVQNIRVLLKNYKTKKIELLTSIFKKINDKSYEEINAYFRDNILRVENVNGSVLASTFLKDNEYFQTEDAPYIKTKNTKPYSLVLDLDETLVHFKVNNEEESEGILQIRPGVVPFLEKVGQYYELIIFTAATQEYGDLLIDAIEENNLYFEHRFYRQHTIIKENDFIKDLSRIGRPLDKIIIVDNMPQNFKLQKENGINIKAFWGEDANDNALEELGIILVNIAREGGDVRIGLEKYKDDILRKVTSNISKNY